MARSAAKCCRPAGPRRWAPRRMMPSTGVAKLIAQAKNPIFLLGLMASQPENSAALRRLLETSHIPVTSTYQAAGAVNQDNFSRFAGRVGLFNNQAGDRLLQLADLGDLHRLQPGGIRTGDVEQRQRDAGAHRRAARL